ncbi:MAG: HAMP domain-containing sensor histidine kinase, partial [Hydrogenophaga sp.]
LFADISHELRTPTTVIRGEAEVALRGKTLSAEDFREVLRRIVEVARQLALVIDDLLTMARSDIDALALSKQSLDPWHTLAEAFQQVMPMAAQRAIQLVLHPPMADSPRVSADALRLRQLILVLLDNAVRYSHRGGQIDVAMVLVKSAAGCAMVEVCVTDQGIGIAADELPRVFERHFRGAQARTHRHDGTGLGLAIGAVLARAHGGEILLESQHGLGTTARLRLPLLALDGEFLEIP